MSSLLANLGVQMLGVAVGWQVYSLTHRAIDLGYVGLVQFAPAVGLSLQDVSEVVLTHAHGDHIDGLVHVRGRVTINELEMSEVPVAKSYSPSNGAHVLLGIKGKPANWIPDTVQFFTNVGSGGVPRVNRN